MSTVEFGTRSRPLSPYRYVNRSGQGSPQNANRSRPSSARYIEDDNGNRERRAMEKVLTEVENSRTYLLRGLILADKSNQTEDKDLLPFDEMDRMVQTFHRELDVIRCMLQVNQDSKIQMLVDQVYDTIKDRLQTLEQNHRAEVDRARQDCKAQLKGAVRELLQTHKNYNAYALHQADEQLGDDIRRGEARVEKVASKLRQMEDEEERLRYSIARAYLLLKRKGLLSEAEIAVADEARMRTVDVVDQYQSMLSKRDDEIFWLRGQISELEEFLDEDVSPDSRPRTQTTQHHRTSVSGSTGTLRLGSSRTAMMRSMSTALDTLIEDTSQPSEDGGDQVESDAEDEDELAVVDELERTYEEKIRVLEEEHMKEVAAATAEHDRILHGWEVRLSSLLQLQDQEHVKRVTKRQEELLQLAMQVYKPRPPADKEVTAYTAGLTLQMLLDEEARCKEIEEEENRRRQEEREEEERAEQEELLQGHGSMEFAIYMRGRAVSNRFSSEELDLALGSELPPYSMGAFRGHPAPLRRGTSNRSIENAEHRHSTNSFAKSRSLNLSNDGISSGTASRVSVSHADSKQATVKGHGRRTISESRRSSACQRAPSAGKLALGSTVTRRSISRAEVPKSQTDPKARVSIWQQSRLLTTADTEIQGMNVRGQSPSSPHDADHEVSCGTPMMLFPEATNVAQETRPLQPSIVSNSMVTTANDIEMELNHNQGIMDKPVIGRSLMSGGTSTQVAGPVTPSISFIPSSPSRDRPTSNSKSSKPSSASPSPSRSGTEEELIDAISVRPWSATSEGDVLSRLNRARVSHPGSAPYLSKPIRRLASGGSVAARSPPIRTPPRKSQ
ncbi:uncharacterized protein SPPG_04627 [Spizellomyces punctatus DAOM BR117]|uniref:DUF4709 domain-containing protein n=1 Tax=Spizellomyces punctatus (strain DAOM BR117) TaxID=645134 RepID=A0A0L0HFN5_SPIPD|nr:uncharacterized protein SPPG_04627 [Spizellomyces punctatus DAOM BR117]KND00301.1 hypothetical protein SPPG_04627 [Spizellomyces punctatus DAOM BR117]|eukprot:XP_016608340.1 hypothetical protein SPPG_04627 [Spizellomyces punctatus DAOM BR117]